MNLDAQRHRYRALDDWFKTPQGHYLGEAFALQLSQFIDHLQNDVLLQLGLCGQNLWLDEHAFKHTWTCTPCLDAPAASLIASPLALPFQRNSVDIMVVPMMLEIFGQYNSPLDEIDRVLSPMGHVIFLGINPISLWGAALLVRSLPVLGRARMTPHSPLALKRAFLNRGYQQRRFENFHYVLPMQNETWIRNGLFFNEMGKIMPIFPAGFYCMVMQKYTYSPLKPERRTGREPVFSLG